MKKLEDKKTKVNKELKRLKINKPRVFQDRMKTDK